MATAAIKFKESGFKVTNLAEFRDKPEVDFAHRLKTKEHLEYLQGAKLLDVRDKRWTKATIKAKCVTPMNTRGAFSKFGCERRMENST